MSSIGCAAGGTGRGVANVVLAAIRQQTTKLVIVELAAIILNRPGFRRGRLCESGQDGLIAQRRVIVFLSFRQRHIPEPIAYVGWLSA